MGDRDSLQKARYCRAVMGTATISDIDQARHLIGCLVTEPPTANASPAVQAAEAHALASIATLHERLAMASTAAAAGEWKLAEDAVRRWIEAAD
jgi:hypothetical protein